LALALLRVLMAAPGTTAHPALPCRWREKCSVQGSCGATYGSLHWRCRVWRAQRHDDPRGMVGRLRELRACVRAQPVTI